MMPVPGVQVRPQSSSCLGSRYTYLANGAPRSKGQLPDGVELLPCHRPALTPVQILAPTSRALCADGDAN